MIKILLVVRHQKFRDAGTTKIPLPPKSAHLFHFDSGVVTRDGVGSTIISFISIIWAVVPIFETGEFKAVLNFLPIKIAEKIPSLKLLVN